MWARTSSSTVKVLGADAIATAGGKRKREERSGSDDAGCAQQEEPALKESQKQQQPMTQDALRDLEEMLKVRGLRPAPAYADEPQEDRRGPQGGGGRRQLAGMKAPVPKKRGRSEGAGTKREAPDADEAERQKRARQDESDPAADDFDLFAELEEAMGADSCGR